MSQDIFLLFENLIDSQDFDKNTKERFLVALKKLSLQEQIFLLQLFQKYPEKIIPFWKISQKKFSYLKNGVGNLDSILEEEIKIFS